MLPRSSADHTLSRRWFCGAVLGGLVIPEQLKSARKMPHRPVNPTAFSYAQAHLVEAPARFLFVSGQIPVDQQDRVPEDFESQCRLAWRNVERQLLAAGMRLADLVKVTVYLSDRKYRDANSSIRREILGPHAPALTIVIADIYDEAWLLEIEAIAAT